MKSLMYLTIMATILFWGISTAFADELSEQEIRTLRANNNLQKKIIKRQKKKIEALQEKIKLHTVQLPQSDKSKNKSSSARQKTKIKNKKKNKPIEQRQLFSMAKRCLNFPTNTTQAKKKMLKDKFAGEIIDQKICIQGTLIEVTTSKAGILRHLEELKKSDDKIFYVIVKFENKQQAKYVSKRQAEYARKRQIKRKVKQQTRQAKKTTPNIAPRRTAKVPIEFIEITVAVATTNQEIIDLKLGSKVSVEGIATHVSSKAINVRSTIDYELKKKLRISLLLKNGKITRKGR